MELFQPEVGQHMEVSNLCHSLTDCKVGLKKALPEGMLYSALPTKPLSIFC